MPEIKEGGAPENRKDINRLITESFHDPKARTKLERLGYEIVLECDRCGALNVGPAHALGCMSGLRAVWRKKEEEKK